MNTVSVMAYPWETRPLNDTLAYRFVKMAKLKWSSFAVGDTLGKCLTYGKLLIGVVLLGKKLQKITSSQENVAILMPTSVGGVVVNLALTLIGKTVINLNYTAGSKNIQAALDLCDIKTVITSHLFLKKLKVSKTSSMVFLEDIFMSIKPWEKIWIFLQCRLMTGDHLWVRFGNRLHTKDSLAAIIFSSGSTGEPKGIMLTHYNILSNIEQLAEVFPLAEDERFVGILPFFHSFGYTGTIWLPLVIGRSVAYHPNPTEARQTGELVKKFQCTLMISTPTFCNNYVKNCSPDMFQSLRHIITGAEKLKKTVALSFKHKFGLEILEGYGCTELSPVVSVNIPGKNKSGTIGHALPGIEARTVDPDDLDIDLEGDEGLLLIRGPNVTLGYYKRPDLTRAAFHGDWYITGDIASISNRGYLTIHDRLARFSKVGGEMVPHLQVEEEINAILGDPNSFVCGVPDQQKGEQLIALYVHKTMDAKAIWKGLQKSSLPNLWIPKQNHIYKINQIPLLGTGKVDLKTAQEKAYLLSQD